MTKNDNFDILGVVIPRKDVEKYIVKIGRSGQYKEYMTVAGKIKMFMKFLNEKGYFYKLDEEMQDEENRVKISIIITVYKIEESSTIPLYKFSGSAAEYRDKRGGFINATYAVENAETSAIGRALGLGLGIGTELGSVESAERMTVALSKSENASEKQKTYIKQAIAHFDEKKRSMLNMVLNDQFGINNIESLNTSKLNKSTASSIIDVLMDIRNGKI